MNGEKFREENWYPGYRTGERNLYHLRNIYLCAIGAIMAPFKFKWRPDLDKTFKENKAEIVRLVKNGAKMFDPEIVTCLSTNCCQTCTGCL